MSKCKLTIYDEPAKSGRCTCSEEREQGEEEHRKADGNAAAEVLGHRGLFLRRCGWCLVRGRRIRRLSKGRKTEERRGRAETSATEKGRERGGEKQDGVLGSMFGAFYVHSVLLYF